VVNDVNGGIVCAADAGSGAGSDASRVGVLDLKADELVRPGDALLHAAGPGRHRLGDGHGSGVARDSGVGAVVLGNTHAVGVARAVNVANLLATVALSRARAPRTVVAELPRVKRRSLELTAAALGNLLNGHNFFRLHLRDEVGHSNLASLAKLEEECLATFGARALAAREECGVHSNEASGATGALGSLGAHAAVYEHAVGHNRVPLGVSEEGGDRGSVDGPLLVASRLVLGLAGTVEGVVHASFVGAKAGVEARSGALEAREGGSVVGVALRTADHVDGRRSSVAGSRGGASVGSDVSEREVGVGQRGAEATFR